MRYRKKPVVIDAVQWTGNNASQLFDFAELCFDIIEPNERQYTDDPDATAQIFDKLHSTWVLVYDGDYIIRGIKGEFYPCREEVFNETYEAA